MIAVIPFDGIIPKENQDELSIPGNLWLDYFRPSSVILSTDRYIF